MTASPRTWMPASSPAGPAAGPARADPDTRRHEPSHPTAAGRRPGPAAALARPPAARNRRCSDPVVLAAATPAGNQSLPRPGAGPGPGWAAARSGSDGPRAGEPPSPRTIWPRATAAPAPGPGPWLAAPHSAAGAPRGDTGSWSGRRPGPPGT